MKLFVHPRDKYFKRLLAPPFDLPLLIDPADTLPYWQLIGRILKVRNIAHPIGLIDPNGEPEKYLALELKKLGMGTVDQGVLGSAQEWRLYKDVISPWVSRINSCVQGLDSHKQQLDSLVKQVLVSMVAPLVGAETNRASDAIEWIMAYNESYGVYMATSEGGFYHYVMSAFEDTDGVPVSMPTSINPNILDEWV